MEMLRDDGTLLEIDISCSRSINDKEGYRLEYNSGKTVWLREGPWKGHKPVWNGRRGTVDKKGNVLINKDADERQERKNKIEDLTEQIIKLQGEIKNIIEPHVREAIEPHIEENLWFLDYVCVPHWNCDESPFGWCVYNKEKDSVWDNCIFCGKAYERK